MWPAVYIPCSSINHTCEYMPKLLYHFMKHGMSRFPSMFSLSYLSYHKEIGEDLPVLLALY